MGAGLSAVSKKTSFWSYILPRGDSRVTVHELSMTAELLVV